MKKFKRPAPLAIIKLGPYPYDVVLFNDRAKYDRYREWSMKKPLGEPELSTVDRCWARTCWLQGGKVYAVGVFHRDVGSLVHELCHVIIGAFDDMNLQIKDQSSEAFTYLLDHMMKECRQKLWPRKKRSK